MSEDHERLHADLAAHALGALDGAERAALETHLNGCAECSRLLSEYSQAVELLPLALPAIQPPPGAKTALMERVRAEAPEEYVNSSGPVAIRPATSGIAGTPPPVRERRNRGTVVWLRPLGWAAAAAVILGLLAWNVNLRREQDATLRALRNTPAERIAPMVSTAAAPGARGRLHLSEDSQTAVLVVEGLPQLEAGRTYQFWFATQDKTRRDSAGVFQVDGKGQAIVSLSLPGPVSQYAEIWITQEPAGGSAVPTAPHFLEGPLV